MKTQNSRLRELDFLRGIAIILVIFRHKPAFEWTTNMGWIGVDLFFVLSGFLVSGLLFQEYLHFGNIDITRFLIRRGFKIYPLYYIFYLPYLIPLWIGGTIQVGAVLADLVFVQNYANGLGYAYSASWTLAVEEHFYLGLALLLGLGTRTRFLRIQPDKHSRTITNFEILVLCLMLFSLFMRIITNFYFPELMSKNSTMTHLRIDSLFAGVLVADVYFFRKTALFQFFFSYKIPLFLVIILGIAWTAFALPIPDFYPFTFGVTLLYISFSLLLIAVLAYESINEKLDRIFTKKLVDAISKTGYASYAIYIIHLFVIWSLERLFASVNIRLPVLLDFAITLLLCIGIGIFITNTVEKYFLAIRNRKFPRRSTGTR